MHSGLLRVISGATVSIAARTRSVRVIRLGQCVEVICERSYSMLKHLFIILSLFLLVSAVAFSQDLQKGETLPVQGALVVEIYHCTACGFRSKAIRLAEELTAEFGIEPQLIRGETGSFDVYVNGDLLFSKSDEGRFPHAGEIVERIREYTGSSG
jgi:selenoprotein W-related protein